MSAVFSALVTLASIAIVHGAYDDCGSQTITVNGEDIILQLGRDATNEMVKITATGPVDKWFGVVLGQGTMVGYAISGEGDGTYALVERTLSQYNPGTAKTTASGTVTANLDTNGVITLERPYLFNDDTTYGDFTDLMTCVTDTMDTAGVIGSSLAFEKHAFETASQTFTRTCDCSTSAPSAATNDPSTAPTKAPIDSYELCAESELITDVTLAIYRDATNEMMKIAISGENTRWFGYGFGTTGMLGSYAVTMEGSDSDQMTLIQRSLTQKSAPPGTVRSYGSSSKTISGSTVTGILEMAYGGAAAEDFDFTPFLTCVDASIPLIAAVGSDGATAMAKHSEAVGSADGTNGMTLTRQSSCTCDGDVETPTPTASANNIFNGFYVILAVFMASLFN